MSSGGDTGIDADFCGDGYVCFECSDDIELGDEVELNHYIYCPECAKEIQRRDEKNGVYPEKWDDAN